MQDHGHIAKRLGHSHRATPPQDLLELSPEELGSNAQREKNEKIRQHLLFECERGQSQAVRETDAYKLGPPLPVKDRTTLSAPAGNLAPSAPALLLPSPPPAAGVDGRVPVQQVQGAQVHVLPDADALRGRADDHVRDLRELQQPLEVLLKEGRPGLAAGGAKEERLLVSSARVVVLRPPCAPDILSSSCTLELRWLHRAFRLGSEIPAAIGAPLLVPSSSNERTLCWKRTTPPRSIRRRTVLCSCVTEYL